MESSNLRIGSITVSITGRCTMTIEPFAHEELLRTLETTYKGVLVVPLETYAHSKLDLPLFSSLEEIKRLANDQVVLCLIPNPSSEFEEPIQLLYESYTRSKRRFNVYDCQQKIFTCMGAAVDSLPSQKIE